VSNTSSNHKAGYVNIIGLPNAGKSTLMNALLGENLSIVTRKAQTTRHRILGMYNDDDHQIIFSDTPGWILEPAYALQQDMNNAVLQTFEDGDLTLMLTEVNRSLPWEGSFLEKVQSVKTPIVIVVNKIDLVKDEALLFEQVNIWKERIPTCEIFPVSALTQRNTVELRKYILAKIPCHPPYFNKEHLSDQNERFFASEIIREQILELFHEEIPYACQVEILAFKEEKKLLRISAEIFVERDSQKRIIIGKKGSSLKKLGIASRKKLESFFGKQVYVETHIKVRANWRNSEHWLRQFGYRKS
tara:strand:+ start:387 stop:1292 length:906 start_codon:yes stop_codon:yes gene_type:complete